MTASTTATSATTKRTTAHKTTTARKTSASRARNATSKPTAPQQPASPEASTEDPASTHEQVWEDPRKLLIDTNIRVDAETDAEFIDSIRTWGILQPIVAVRTTTKDLRVRFGHRRTLGAIAAERFDVPVWVVGDENTDDAAQIERVLMQYDENDKRAGLSRADEVNTMAQLAAFGLPAEQIGQRLRKDATSVEAALKIAKSDLAKKATLRYDFLDLTQAAAVAEFDDDVETVKILITEARNGAGRFDHALQRARDARDEAAKIAALTATLREAGIQVISTEHDTAQRLDCLTSADTGERLSTRNHTDCPGHAATVVIDHDYLNAAGQPVTDDEDSETDSEDDQTHWGSYAEAQYVCVDPETHGHLQYWKQLTPPTSNDDTTDSDDQDAGDTKAARKAEEEQRKAARRAVIANNKAWASAQTVRRNWLRNLAKRKNAPKRSASFIAASFAADAGILASDNGHALACDLLGCAKVGYGRSGDLRDLVTKATEARAQVLTLAQILAAYEASTNKEHWRSQHSSTQRYLRYLESCGYTLSDVERLACGEDPNTADTADTADSDPTTDTEPVTEPITEPINEPGATAHAA